MSEESTAAEVEVATEVERGTWQEEAGVAGDATFERFGQVADLASSYTDLRKSFSRAASFPGVDASDEVRADFQGRVLEHDDSLMVRPDGYAPAPESADAYSFEAVDGANIDPETEAEFKVAAHALGMSPAQAAGTHKLLAENVAKNQAAVAEANEAGMRELKGLYGNALDEKIAIAKNAMANMSDRVSGVNEMFEALASIGHDATGIKMAIAMSELMGEAGHVPATHRTQLTPDEATDNLFELDNKYAHLSEGERGWDQYQEKRMQYYKAGANKRARAEVY